MADNIKLLTARRIYDFPPDVIRLSLLSVSTVVQRIRDIFNFQGAQVANQTTSEIGTEVTLMPVVVFNNGTLPEDDQTIMPIRFLLIEPRRFTIEVGGKSQAAVKVYDRLQAELAMVRGPDGVPAGGRSPIGEADFTTLIAQCNFAPEALIAPALRRLYRQTGSLGQRTETVLNASLTVRKQATAAEFPGATPTDTSFFQLEVRAGTRPADRIYFSAAPLPTDAHIAYLGELEAALERRSRGT